VLKHNYYTDIITFNLSTESGILEAEIYISVERVKENALNYKEAYTKELHRVIFHGILHLFGYNDKKPEEVKEMRLAEERLIKAYLK
jgi:probable rRNA maturation factor